MHKYLVCSYYRYFCRLISHTTSQLIIERLMVLQDSTYLLVSILAEVQNHVNWVSLHHVGPLLCRALLISSAVLAPWTPMDQVCDRYSYVYVCHLLCLSAPLWAVVFHLYLAWDERFWVVISSLLKHLNRLRTGLYIYMHH